MQSWFKTTCIVFYKNISAGHTSLLQVYRCYWTYEAITILLKKVKKDRQVTSAWKSASSYKLNLSFKTKVKNTYLPINSYQADLSHALSGSRFYTSYLASLKQRGRLGGGLCQIALWNYFLEGGEFWSSFLRNLEQPMKKSDSVSKIVP